MITSVAFIILNYKTFEDTIILGKEILNNYIPNSVIIIVDNCSPNDSYQQLVNAFGSEPTVDVIASPVNGGYAKGNNLGLRYAKKYNPEYVCIINNDVHFFAETISQLINDIETNENVGAIAPKQLLPNGEDAAFSNLKIGSFGDALWDYIIAIPRGKIVYKSTTDDGKLMKVGFVPGSFVFMRFSVAERIDFFDESTFLFNEERFLAKRLEQVGLGCYIDINTSYVHAHSKTIKTEMSFFQKRKTALQSRCLFIKKYYKHGRAKSAILYGAGYIVLIIKSLYHK
jgi:GT2 family glycosyltransferase